MDVLYHVTFDDFCDWYAEAIKPRLYAGDEDAQATALANLERLLKVLHPAMPHVTEEIWSNLPARESRLILASWPGPAGAEDATGEFEPIRVAAEVFRRAGVQAPLDEEQQRIFDAVVKPERAKVDGGNVEAEAERLRGEIARAEKMLANERFVQNAPGDVVEAEREKLERYRRELQIICITCLAVPAAGGPASGLQSACGRFRRDRLREVPRHARRCAHERPRAHACTREIALPARIAPLLGPLCCRPGPTGPRSPVLH